jgi:hypothetical protein
MAFLRMAVETQRLLITSLPINALKVIFFKLQVQWGIVLLQMTSLWAIMRVLPWSNFEFKDVFYIYYVTHRNVQLIKS